MATAPWATATALTAPVMWTDSTLPLAPITITLTLIAKATTALTAPVTRS